MVSDAARRLIRPTVQACRHDKTRLRRIGICAWCRMRRERLIRPTVQAVGMIRRACVASGIGAWCRMGASALSDLRFRPVGMIRRAWSHQALSTVSDAVRAPYPTYVQACRHDKTRQRRIRHLRTTSDAPRDASDNTLLFHRLADLSNDAGSSMVVRSPGSRPSQTPGSCGAAFFRIAFLAIARQPDVRRAAKVANLAVHQRHNRFSCECATSRSSRLSLSFGMKTPPPPALSAHLSPQPPPLRNARMTGDTLFNLARPQPMPGTLITSSVRPRIK